MEPEQDASRVPMQEKQAPKDLARLKNWSNFEEASYRDFSQQRAERRTSAHRRIAETQKSPSASAPEPAPEPSPRFIPPPVVTPAEARVPLLTNPGLAPMRSAPGVPAAVAIFSPAGGAGRSTVAAHLARSLYTRGERVLLVNASGHGLLSTYFGSSEEREGLRQFCAPGEAHASVLLYHREHLDSELLQAEVEPIIQGVDRTIFDLSYTSPDLAARVLSWCQLVLVPVTPAPQAAPTVRRLLGIVEKTNSKARPYFLLNRFREDNEQDWEVRRGLEETFADCAAPVTLSFSDEVDHAFYERMTLGDYHPSSPLAMQFERLAAWLRKAVPPSVPATGRRWSEM